MMMMMMMMMTQIRHRCLFRNVATCKFNCVATSWRRRHHIEKPSQRSAGQDSRSIISSSRRHLVCGNQWCASTNPCNQPFPNDKHVTIVYGIGRPLVNLLRELAHHCVINACGTLSVGFTCLHATSLQSRLAERDRRAVLSTIRHRKTASNLCEGLRSSTSQDLLDMAWPLTQCTQLVQEHRHIHSQGRSGWCLSSSNVNSNMLVIAASGMMMMTQIRYHCLFRNVAHAN